MNVSYKSLNGPMMRQMLKYVKSFNLTFDPLSEKADLAHSVFRILSSNKLRSANPRGTVAELNLVQDKSDPKITLTWIDDHTETFDLGKFENSKFFFRELHGMHQLLDNEITFKQVLDEPTSRPTEADPIILGGVKKPRPWVTGIRAMKNPKSDYFTTPAPVIHGRLVGEKTSQERNRDAQEAAKAGKKPDYDILSDDLLALDWYSNPQLIERFQARQIKNQRLKELQRKSAAKKKAPKSD